VNLWLAPLFFAVGICAGFSSGLLGIGGGLVAVPAALYLPRLLGLGELDIRDAAALGMVVSFFASTSGVVVHNRFKHVDRALLWILAPGLVVGAWGGAFSSKWLPHEVLQGTFGVFGVLAAALLLFSRVPESNHLTGAPIVFNRWLGFCLATGIGFVSGMLGLGGGFLMIPAMIWLLHIPTRQAIGSSLGIIALAATAGFIGKLMTAQVPFQHALFLVLGASVGAQFGGRVSVVTRERILRVILGALLMTVSVRIGWELLS
jgi:uncharacterized membrane protein YfcA